MTLGNMRQLGVRRQTLTISVKYIPYWTRRNSSNV